MNEDDVKNLIEKYMNESQYGVTKIPSHLHNGMDTPKITVVDLPVETPVRLGLGAIISFDANKNVAPGNVAEETITAIVSGRDLGGTIGITSENLQVQLEHYPSDTNHFSFFDAFRNPVLTTPQNTTISVSAGGNTMTVSGYGMPTNKFANALIDIFDSTGALIETQVVASNTGSTITITGTWLNTTTGGSFIIFVPVFLGRTQYPWQRLYVQDTINGGIRFGGGPTNGGQNALLYTDGVNLKFRKKDGSIVTIV